MLAARAVTDRGRQRPIGFISLGQPISNDLLTRIRLAIGDYFTGIGETFSRVSIPVQDISSGTIQVVLIRGRVGKIRGAGGRYFSSRSYISAVDLAPGELLTVNELERAADWINLNPFRHATISASPGSRLGEVDLLVHAQDEFPLRVYAGVDDQGQQVTGENQAFVGLNWGNVTGLGDQLDYQHTSALRPYHLHADSISYTLPLPWRNLLVISGSKAQMRPYLPAPLDQLGKSSQAGLRYEIPLPTSAPGGSQMMSFGVDYKTTNNNIEFAQIPVIGNTSAIFQAVVKYAGTTLDRRGVTSWGVELVGSPGDAVGGNNDAAFGQQRFGAHARYAYLNMNLQRDTRLPDDFTWSTQLQGQWASGNLLGSEQLSFGGASLNRGYDPGAVYADEGFDLRNELRLPPVSPLRSLLRMHVSDQLQALVFWDYGIGIVRFPLPQERRQYVLSSVGPGLRYALGQHLSASIDYGWQLIRVDTDRMPRNGRVDFSLVTQW